MRQNNFITEFTEVLTRDGWKTIGEVKSKETLLVLDTDLGINYLKPSIIDSYDFKGSLRKIETDSETLLLRPSTQILLTSKKEELT